MTKSVNNKIFLVSLLSVICYLLFVNISAANAAVRYPIKDLANCANAKECYLYCEIPQNTPACWSYQTYILKSKVLGESTLNITFPITELGNCIDRDDCKNYCQKSQNRDSCLTYGKKHSLIKVKKVVKNKIAPKIITGAKNELGCTTAEECRAYCGQEENADQCRQFALKWGLIKEKVKTEIKTVKEEFIVKAKTEFGCGSERECFSFCADPQNREKCHNFGVKHGIIKQLTTEQTAAPESVRMQMVEYAADKFGCDSVEACATYCAIPENIQKCSEIKKEFQTQSHLIKKEEVKKTCANEEECRSYCEKNPDECKGFETKKSSGGFSALSNEGKNSDFLGPSGCRNESECRSYCQEHPSECPGFDEKEETEEKETTSSPSGPTGPS